ncbi:MAG: hypothetical protein KDC70_00300 [Saprospiraceae bacterium]|nr:hypothetical protein [Saprospiraceae bacterium]
MLTLLMVFNLYPAYRIWQWLVRAVFFIDMKNFKPSIVAPTGYSIASPSIFSNGFMQHLKVKLAAQ